MFKREIRVVGFDDVASPRAPGRKVLLVGIITRGGSYVDGVLSTQITYDGLDATRKLIELLNHTRHKPQLRVVMTSGISFAGFNLVDIKTLSRETSLPVIVVVRKRPNVREFVEALKRFQDFDERRAIVERAGRIYRHKKVYFQCAGISPREARELLDICTTHGNIPEPIRVAHLVASGLSGESKGRP